MLGSGSPVWSRALPSRSSGACTTTSALVMYTVRPRLSEQHGAH